MMAEVIEIERATPVQRTRRWRSRLWNALYALFLIAIIVGLPQFLTWSLNTPYPMAAITSGSMWPVYKEGDLVLIQGVEQSDLRVGDIVVYQNKTNNTLTVHRIVQLNADTFITKGDANFSEDAPALYGAIVGRSFRLFGYPTRIPYLGSVTELAGRLRSSP